MPGYYVRPVRAALYITDGKALNVTWKRANKNEQTKYYAEDGTQVKNESGKTYIAVVPEDFDITLVNNRQ